MVVNNNSIPSGSGSLTFNSAQNLLTFTPPDISSFISSETDPIFSASPSASITSANISNWNSAYNWGDHSIVGYLQATNTDKANWNLAYSWGDHSSAGYLTSETDTLDSVTGRGNTTINNISVGQLTAGGLTYPNTNGTSGQVLTSDGTGNIVWAAGGSGGGSTVSDIDDLTDVTISSPTSGQVLYYNGTNWTNGVTSSYGDSDVSTHLNTSSASAGQILSWNGTDFVWVADQTGSSGSSTFVGLTDTPSSMGTAGQFIAVNSGGTALEFVAAPSGGGGANVTISDNPPANPTSGDLWWESDKGRLKILYSTVWVDANPVGGGGGSGTSYTNGDVDSHLNTSGATSNQILSWNGTDYTWIAQVDTDTTYTAGTGISLVGTQFSLDSTSSPTFAGMSLNGTALPFTDGTFDLGSTTKKWRFVYTDGLVAGGLTYPTSNGTSGQVLTSNGSGGVTWTTVSGGGGGGATSLNGLSDVNTGTISTGNVLQYDGTAGAWVANNLDDIPGHPVISWTLTQTASAHYIFAGEGFPATAEDPTLYLIRGQSYVFKNRTGGHPFRIQSTTATPGGGTQYNVGVTNNDAANNTDLIFVVPMNAPDTLYYQCTSHPAMFGTINILNAQQSIALNDLTDVDAVSNATNGYILKYNGATWEMAPDLTGSVYTLNEVLTAGNTSSVAATVGDLTCSNLTVNGTTTTVNSNNVNIGDSNLTLNSDETGTPSQNGGLTIERGTSDNVEIRWNETSDKWEFTNDGTSYTDLGGGSYSDSDVESLMGQYDFHIIPTSNANYDIGTAERKVRHLFLSDNSIKFTNDQNPPVSFSLGAPNGKLTFEGKEVATVDTTGLAEGDSMRWQASTASFVPDQRLNEVAPVGSIMMYGGSTAPPGWLLCDGTSTASYGALAAVVGQYTPDLRDRFIIAAGTTYAVGTTGGEAEVTLTEAQMPSHSHTWTRQDSSVNAGYRPWPANNNDVVGTTVNTSSAGGDQAHNNIPPYYALVFIIKT
jgi:microcystin-dependent protein